MQRDRIGAFTVHRHGHTPQPVLLPLLLFLASTLLFRRGTLLPPPPSSAIPIGFELELHTARDTSDVGEHDLPEQLLALVKHALSPSALLLGLAEKVTLPPASSRNLSKVTPNAQRPTPNARPTAAWWT
jgi:hypothetical protein